jgi:hypothetical protein
MSCSFLLSSCFGHLIQGLDWSFPHAMTAKGQIDQSMSERPAVPSPRRPECLPRATITNTFITAYTGATTPSSLLNKLHLHFEVPEIYSSDKTVSALTSHHHGQQAHCCVHRTSKQLILLQGANQSNLPGAPPGDGKDKKDAKVLHIHQMMASVRPSKRTLANQTLFYRRTSPSTNPLHSPQPASAAERESRQDPTLPQSFRPFSPLHDASYGTSGCSASTTIFCSKRNT